MSRGVPISGFQGCPKVQNTALRAFWMMKSFTAVPDGWRLASVGNKASNAVSLVGLPSQPNRGISNFHATVWSLGVQGLLGAFQGLGLFAGLVGFGVKGTIYNQGPGEHKRFCVCGLGFQILRVRLPTHGLHSSSFLGFTFRILQGSPKKKLLWSLWVDWTQTCSTFFGYLSLILPDPNNKQVIQ